MNAKATVLDYFDAANRGLDLLASGINLSWDVRLTWRNRRTHATTVRAAIVEAFETVDEGKRQWDQVAGLLGAHGDDVDAVLARAKAVRELINADVAYNFAMDRLAKLPSDASRMKRNRLEELAQRASIQRHLALVEVTR